MRGATLFSGIGAPECAAAEIDWLWGAETDDFASAVLQARFGLPNLGDVSGPDFVERALAIGRPDILVFGSPCQSFSVAGKRLGLDDARGNLALVALAVARQLRPRWLVFENVPGLFSSFSGSEQAECQVREGDIGGQADGEEDRDFAAFLCTVRECGYTGCWRVLDAQYFGVPQRRRRVFFVGHLGNDWRRAAAVLFEPESLRGDSPPRREAGQDIAPTISARTKGGGGLGTDFDLDGGLIAHTLTGAAFDASEDGTGRGTPLVPIAFDCKAGGKTGFAIGNLPAALRGVGHGGGHAAIAIQERAVSENPAAGPDGKGWSSRSYIATQYAVRRLTPLECERAQGLPDHHTNIPWKGKNHAPDSRRYKAIGNSMAVPVMRWILDRVRLADEMMEAA